jgi:hypothetical protein
MVNIDREHHEYLQRKRMWRCYRDLYAGGQQLKDNASEYLTRRQKEPLDVYAERLNRAYYENHIGSIIDWYAATLFRREPILYFDGDSDNGRRFLTVFSDNCDLKSTSLADLFRQCFIDTLVSGASHLLLDFPRLDQIPVNRAEEDAAGHSRAYLLRYSAEELMNWSNDENGDYEWIVLRRQQRRQPDVESTQLVDETYWYYFDKQRYRVYRREKEQDQGSIYLVAEGSHALSNLNRVPLFTRRNLPCLLRFASCRRGFD